MARIKRIQPFYQDSVGPFVKNSTTQVYLGPSSLIIGGVCYTTTANTYLTVSGLTANSLYMVYAVVSGGAVILVHSTNVNSVGPAGYTSWKLVGAFIADSTTTIGSLVNINGAPESAWIQYTPTFASGYGTCANVDFRYKRIGTEISIMGSFITGTTSRGSASDITIPSGLVLLSQYGDSSYRPKVTGTFNRWANGQVFNTESSYWGVTGPGFLMYSPFTTVFCLWYRCIATSNDMQNVDYVSTFLANGDQVSCDFKWPISGWSNIPLKDL